MSEVKVANLTSATGKVCKEPDRAKTKEGHRGACKAPLEAHCAQY